VRLFCCVRRFVKLLYRLTTGSEINLARKINGRTIPASAFGIVHWRSFVDTLKHFSYHPDLGFAPVLLRPFWRFTAKQKPVGQKHDMIIRQKRHLSTDVFRPLSRCDGYKLFFQSKRSPDSPSIRTQAHLRKSGRRTIALYYRLYFGD
jgi:hypothetical protein